MELWKVSLSCRCAGHTDEVSRRGDGHWPHVQGIAIQRSTLAGSGQAFAARKCAERRTAKKTRAAKLAKVFLHHLRAGGWLVDCRNLSPVTHRSVVSRSAQAGDGDSA